MLPPKLRNIPSCLASEFFFVNKNSPPQTRSLIENTMGNPFFGVFIILTKTNKKNWNSNYIRFYQKTAFGNDFGPQKVPKIKIKKRHFHIHALSGWGTSRGLKVVKAVFS